MAARRLWHGVGRGTRDGPVATGLCAFWWLRALRRCSAVAGVAQPRWRKWPSPPGLIACPLTLQGGALPRFSIARLPGVGGHSQCAAVASPVHAVARDAVPRESSSAASFLWAGAECWGLPPSHAARYTRGRFTAPDDRPASSPRACAVNRARRGLRLRFSNASSRFSSLRWACRCCAAAGVSPAMECSRSPCSSPCTMKRARTHALRLGASRHAPPAPITAVPSASSPVPEMERARRASRAPVRCLMLDIRPFASGATLPAPTRRIALLVRFVEGGSVRLRKEDLLFRGGGRPVPGSSLPGQNLRTPVRWSRQVRTAGRNDGSENALRAAGQDIGHPPVSIAFGAPR